MGKPKQGELPEKHPHFDDVYYVERFCACGSILKIRGHKESLWNGDDTGIVDNWERRHSKPPHKAVTEAVARKQRELFGAFSKGG